MHAGWVTFEADWVRIYAPDRLLKHVGPCLSTGPDVFPN